MRPLHEIAREIARDWKKPYFGAVPYLQAMMQLDSITDMYGYDDARSVVLYFLSNATTWRGDVARRIKKELNDMLKGRSGSSLGDFGVSNYQSDAERAVKETAQTIHDPDTVYRGEHPLGKTWAITFSVNRDSDLLSRTNWDVITADMQKRFPKSTDVERFSHWAVGWVDYFVVRMLDRQGQVTKAGIAALEWQGALENYPIADEEEFSKREFEESHEAIQSLVSVSGEDAHRIWEVLFHAGKETSPNSMRDREVEEALQAIRTEDIVKSGIPEDIVELVFGWMRNSGFNATDIDDLDKVFAVVDHLHAEYHLSTSDAKRVLDKIVEEELDLLDPVVVRGVVASLQLRPEDVETLPPPGLSGLSRIRGKLCRTR